MPLALNTKNYLFMLAQLNEGWWPAHLAAYALACAALGLALARRPEAARWVTALLAALWVGCAGVYFLAGFSRLSPAAYAFAVIFVLEGLGLVWAGWRRPGLEFVPRLDGYGVLGVLLVLYALLGQPLLGAYLDQPWPHLGLVGLDPNPTVLFSLGMLMFSRGRLPKQLLAVPVLWCFLGFLLAVEFGIRQDVVILPAGLAAVSLLLPRDLKHPGHEPDGA
jgi:hypothetical protein